MERVVIIGAGQAGVQAVQSLRAAGYAGEMVMIGDEPFPPYQRPPLSKTYLSGDLARERLFLKPDGFFTDSNCELRTGVRATAIDRAGKNVALADGGTVQYSKLLLTTGTHPRKIRVPGAGLAGVFYLRGIEDVDQLRPAFAPGMKLSIVGGGYIGLEVAAVAQKRGLEVTVIECEKRLMPRTASPAISKFYEMVHRAAGVNLALGAAAQAFTGETRVEGVLAGGEMIPADIVLVGIGVIANDELAREAGIACGDGIIVDEFTRTSDPDVFAAGDCTQHPSRDGSLIRLESVQNAIEQAKCAAATIAGDPKSYRDVPWFWSDQYDLKLQIAGIARSGDTLVLRGEPASRKFAVFHLRGGAVVAVEAVNAAPEYIAGRKLIADGAHIDPDRLADLSIPMKSMTA
jgi:3-phenylpropionate/trans-cinnamate dioxygenase ferredoxin reductase component